MDNEQKYEAVIKGLTPGLIAQAFVSALNKHKIESSSAGETEVTVSSEAKVQCSDLFPDLPVGAVLQVMVEIKGSKTKLAEFGGTTLLNLLRRYGEAAVFHYTFGPQYMDERVAWKSEEANMYNSKNGSPFFVTVELLGLK